MRRGISLKCTGCRGLTQSRRRRRRQRVGSHIYTVPRSRSSMNDARGAAAGAVGEAEGGGGVFYSGKTRWKCLLNTLYSFAGRALYCTRGELVIEGFAAAMVINLKCWAVLVGTEVGRHREEISLEDSIGSSSYALSRPMYLVSHYRRQLYTRIMKLKSLCRIVIISNAKL